MEHKKLHHRLAVAQTGERRKKSISWNCQVSVYLTIKTIPIITRITP